MVYKFEVTFGSETYKRTSEIRYMYASYKRTSDPFASRVSWHKTEAAARRRGGYNYKPVNPINH